MPFVMVTQQLLNKGWQLLLETKYEINGQTLERKLLEKQEEDKM